jgi:hypothetical protein
MLILLIIWTVGMYIMWLYSHVTMRRRGRDHVAGEYKAILELADEMRRQLDSGDSNDSIYATNVKESELYRRITKDLRGGAISYNAPLLPDQDYQDEEGSWIEDPVSFVEREILWISALVLSTLTSILAGVIAFLPMGIGLVGLTLALIITLSIGTNHSSKSVILFWSCWALAVIPEVVAIVGLLSVKNTTSDDLRLKY